MRQDKAEVKLLLSETIHKTQKKSSSPLWQVWKLLSLFIIFGIIVVWVVFTLFPSLEINSKQPLNNKSGIDGSVNCSVIPTNNSADDGRGFQEIAPGTLVYSAFYDDTRTTPSVHIIAISETFRPPKIYCHWICGSSKTKEAKFRLVDGHKNRRHAAFIISCDLPKGLDGKPAFMHLSAEYDFKRTQIFSFPIHYSSNINIDNYTVCIPPLFGNEVSLVNFIEFVEMNQILGVNKFIIYSEYIHKGLIKAVNFYQKQGVVKVMPWNLPHYINDFYAIHYHGQIVSIQDCLYRNRGRTKWLGFHDLDEFLVPLKQANIPSLLKAVYEPEASGYCIQSILLPKNNVFTAEDQTNTTLITQQFVFRTVKVFKKRKRSKCVVDPKKVFEMGIHFINKPMYDNYRQTWISPEQALVFHYRQCVQFQDLKEACHQLETVGFMLKYKNTLKEKVNHILKIIT